MRRYLLHMSYVGTNFRGMQKQNSLPTIQGSIEAALAGCVKPPSLLDPLLQISSRTDSGVHALSSTAHVDLIHPNNDIYDMERIRRSMNNIFSRNNEELRITSCTEVSQDFHARHSAKSRSYLYRFMIPKEGGQPNFPVVELNRCYTIRAPALDVERVKQGTKLFLGVKDFRTFAGKISNVYQNSEIVYVRKLDYFTFEKGKSLMADDPFAENFDYWNFRCGAKSFLYNQVRRMVGALIALGIGRVTEKDIRCMLEVPSRQSWDSRVVSVPSYGLYLCNVNYDPLDLKMRINRSEKLTGLLVQIDSSFTMSLSSLLEAKRKDLRHRSTILTNMLGEKYEILDNEMKLIDKGLPFVVDTKPDLQVALVEPGLYFGSQDPVASIDILRDYEIKRVISIGINLEVKFEGIKYYFIDLLDLPEASISEALKTCLCIINENKDENVFIHCNAGVSRSASVVIAYLMITNNLSYDKAYEKVKSVRECIKPNEGFVRQLKALELCDFSKFLK